MYHTQCRLPVHDTGAPLGRHLGECTMRKGVCPSCPRVTCVTAATSLSRRYSRNAVNRCTASAKTRAVFWLRTFGTGQDCVCDASFDFVPLKNIGAGRTLTGQIILTTYLRQIPAELSTDKRMYKRGPIRVVSEPATNDEEEVCDVLGFFSGVPRAQLWDASMRCLSSRP